ncbi:unnamed protein product [Acanthoscelides obtectus]|nr:unnamed protein product [Acanthoscelides obtectus]CAK1663542.1 hypothetical protein AOBTE_LOCUS23719 [Acanthoscelides obtectus]
MTGDVDICDVFSEAALPQIGTFLQVFGLPTKCPIPAKKYCADPKKPVSIMQFKNGLAMALGTVTGKMKLKHDGGPSCVQFSFTVNRAMG